MGEHSLELLLIVTLLSARDIYGGLETLYVWKHGTSEFFCKVKDAFRMQVEPKGTCDEENPPNPFPYSGPSTIWLALSELLVDVVEFFVVREYVGSIEECHGTIEQWNTF